MARQLEVKENEIRSAKVCVVHGGLVHWPRRSQARLNQEGGAGLRSPHTCAHSTQFPLASPLRMRL